MDYGKLHARLQSRIKARSKYIQQLAEQRAAYRRYNRNVKETGIGKFESYAHITAGLKILAADQKLDKELISSVYWG